MDRTATRLAGLLDDLEHFGVRLGLTRIERVLEALGSPQVGLPTVLVAGTNGKGSTAAVLAAIGTAAGYRTGLYTSPHLETVEERIRLDGVQVTTGTLVELVEEVIEAARGSGDEPPTYFETLTAAALCHFRRAAVDLAILEVGMGGRLDATNASQPMLSLVTPIGLDHQEYLGGTTAAIAREKAGILRPDRPALAVIPDREARSSLTRVAARVGARLALVDVAARLGRRDARPGRGQSFEVRSERGSYRLESRLEGRHQADNMVLAVVAAERLAELGLERIDRSAIERGVASARWPGRLEWVERPSGGWVLLDAAHNQAGWEALQAYLDGIDRPFDLLFGALREKLREPVVPPLVGRAARVVLTTPPSARGLAAGELAKWLARPVEVEEDPERALERALDVTSEPAADPLLVVCGSLYLVGAVRGELRRRWGVPAAPVELFSVE